MLERQPPAQILYLSSFQLGGQASVVIQEMRDPMMRRRITFSSVNNDAVCNNINDLEVSSVNNNALHNKINYLDVSDCLTGHSKV